MDFTKGLHFNYEIEEAVLGVCMLEKDAFGRIYSIVDKNCFYHFGHQLVFEVISEMYVNGLPIDILTVSDQIFRIRGIDEISQSKTGYFVTKLTNSVVSGANIEYHAAILKSMWMEREIIDLTNGGGKKLTGDIRNKIYDLQAQLHEIQSAATEHEWQDMSALMVQLYQHQEEMKVTKGVGLPTGFRTIDAKNGGLHKGQMVVIGARPSVGKSAFAGMIAMNMARKNFSIGIVSLEMSNVEIAARLASIDTETDFNILYRGLYRDEREMHEVYNIIGNRTSQLPIYVTDKTDVNVTEIKAKAQKLRSLHGIDCLMIDYLQLIDTPDGFNKTRENEISKISRSCKIMAKEMEIPVILLCQLNREVTKRKGAERYPQLSDLRESGAIEQDADVVMFLHRDWLSGLEIDDSGMSTERQADLVVRKWRNGETNFVVPLDFDPPKMKFSEKGNTFHIPSSQTQSFYDKEKDENPF